MKKLIAVAVLLFTVSGIRASSLPNNYAVARTVTYDPNTGTAGTLHISYQFTGTTQVPPQSPMCTTNTTTHTPKITATLSVSGTATAASNVSGTGVNPCVQMNQTLNVSFDLGSDQCSLSLLSDGTCSLSDQQEVFCPVAQDFVLLPFDFEFETAVTYSTISALLVNGWHPQAPYCYAPSMPPDLAPATKAQASIIPGQYVESSFMWREVPKGQSFLGVTWRRVFPIDPETLMPPTFDAPICTNWDAGFRDVQWPL